MIVTCEECSTSFQLDESRIPASGARVRCSRCKHAFFLPSPNVAADEAVHSIAEDAARDSMSGVPAPSSELAAANEGLGAASGAGGTEADAEPEEEDWQFSEEVRIEGDGSDEDDFDPGHDFSADGDFGEGFDEAGLSDSISGEDASVDDADIPEIAREAAAESGVAMDDESGLELDSSGMPDAPVRDESSFGTVDDFSSLMEDEEPVAVDVESESVGDLESAPAEQAAVGTYAGTGATDDLGDPESWDLVGSDGAAGAAASVEGVARSFTERSSAGNSAIPDSFLDGFDSSPYVDEVEETPGWMLHLSKVGAAAGWLVTIALGAVVFFLQVQPEWARWSQPAQVVSRGVVSAETTDTAWIETSRSGLVLVVEGRAQNSGSEPLRLQGVELAFLDAKGQRLVAQPLSVGMPLGERVLREASPAQLASNIDRAMQRFATLPLGPGETREFSAVAPVAQIPDEARRILLEMGEPLAASATVPVAARRSEITQPERADPVAVGAQFEDESD